MTAQQKIDKIRLMVIAERAKIKKNLPQSFVLTMEFDFLNSLAKVVEDKENEVKPKSDREDISGDDLAF